MRWFKSQQAYTALGAPDSHTPHQHHCNDTEAFTSPNPCKQRGPRYPSLAQCFSILLNFVLLCTTIVLYIKVCRLHSPLPPWPSDVYSPAESAIGYETVMFETNLRADRKPGKKNIYLELTDEGDAAWDELTEAYSTSLISPLSASRLPHPTVHSSSQPSKYLVGLSVFHQLHCLSRIRKLLHPERYPWQLAANLSAAETRVHDDHCIDLIRQALMCAGDVSPIHWQWDEDVGMALPSAKGKHTCRRWDGIMQWAKEHNA